VILVSSKIALPSQTPHPRVGWVASQVAAFWAAPLDCRSGSKSAAAVAAAALAAAALAAVVAVAVWEWLALHPRGLCYTLPACTTPLRLGLCPHGLPYALAARAAAAAAAAVEATAANACPRGSRYALAGLGFALTAWLRPLCPWDLRYALAAQLRPNTTIKQQSRINIYKFVCTNPYIQIE
jgi:hypothetical protein